MLINDLKSARLVINLPNRNERLEQFRSEYQKVFASPFTVVPGVIHKNPMTGIGAAHLNCIKYAIDNSLDYVIIMEDDVVFQADINNTQKYIQDALQNTPDDFDILLGGIYTGKISTPYNKHWSRVGEFSGLHFYIVIKSAYDKILKYDFNSHIDRWMGKNLKCYVANEFFAIQSIGYSDNAKGFRDYSNLLNKYKLLK